MSGEVIPLRTVEQIDREISTARTLREVETSAAWQKGTHKIEELERERTAALKRRARTANP